MTTRPLQPPPFIPDDPGPWSVVTHVQRSRGVRPGRRYAEPPRGLSLAQPPEVPCEIVGLDPSLAAVGAGPVKVIGAAREPAHGLGFEGPGALVGVSPGVRRTWTVPELTPSGEQRPEKDPAATLPEPISLADLGGDVAQVASSPDGSLAAVNVLETSRSGAVGIYRAEDGAIVRWIHGAIGVAWSPEGGHLAVGGHWGVLLLAARSEA